MTDSLVSPSKEGKEKKNQASHRHYRSILTDLLLPFPASNSYSLPSSHTYPLMRPWPACWVCYAYLSSKNKARDEGRNRGGSEGEAGSSYEMCLLSEIQLLSSAPLLAASYSLSFCFSISPSRSTHACSCCMATTC